METTAVVIDQETQKIITTYQKIYNLIFRYGTFIVLGLISGIVVMSLSPNPSYSNNRAVTGPQAVLSTILTSGDMFIAKGITLDPKISTAPLTVKVLQGFVSSSEQAQAGYGLLAFNQGMVLPISINTVASTGSHDKAYFSSGSYNPLDLQARLQNNVMTYPLKSVQTALYQYKQNAQSLTSLAPAETQGGNAQGVSLADNFGLNCLGRRNVTSFFCHKNIQQFTSRIPYISLSDKLTELSSIMKYVMDTQYKAAACDNLQYVFSRDPMPKAEWELIFTKCGAQYVSAYHRIVDFTTATYELQGISNGKLYPDDEINAFKLLSLQQKIYHNTIQKNYDIGTIEVYLNFVQDLITKRQNLEQVYKDLIYLYNNTYLEATLTQIAVLTNNTKSMLKLSDMIRNINGGAAGLQKMIRNPSLITYVNENGKGNGATTGTLTSFQELFAGKFASFDNFVVTNQKVNNNSLAAQVEGYFIVPAGGDTTQVLFVGDYIFKDNVFVLTKARFPQNSYLESTLASLIAQKTLDIDIPFVYEFIKNNGTTTAVTLNVCDLLAPRTLNITQCSPTVALFSYRGKVVRINFDGYKIGSLVSNDSNIQAELRAKLQGVITTQGNIGPVLEELLKEVPGSSNPQPSDNETSPVDTNQFTIMSKFKQYLGVTPKSVNMVEGKYIVTFAMRSDLVLIAAVDVGNNYKLSPVAILQGDVPTRVNNFSLNLTNAALTEINQFKTDPWAYIKRVDKNAYDQTHPK